MKCQKCDKQVSQHITELVDGKPVEYHVCDEHAIDLTPGPPPKDVPLVRVLWDTELRMALEDKQALKQVAIEIFHCLCDALQDERPEVRIQAIFRMMCRDAIPDRVESALEVLEPTLSDPDPRVRKIAKLAIDLIKDRRAESE